MLADRKHVQLPRIGVVKTHESTRKLARRLENGTARILAATISRRADRWYVSFTVEVQRAIPSGDHKPSAVGVDVGVRQLAVLSTGAVIANPRALEGSLRKLRRLNRRLARRTPGSRRRTKTRRRLAHVHARAVNLRLDAPHKLTTSLATEHGTVVVEQLNLAGDGAQPPTSPRHQRYRDGQAAPPARIQSDLVRLPAGGGRPVLPLVQDVLWMRVGES